MDVADQIAAWVLGAGYADRNLLTCRTGGPIPLIFFETRQYESPPICGGLPRVALPVLGDDARLSHHWC